MNLYALDLETMRISLAVARPYGIDSFSVAGDEVCIAEGARGGLVPAEARLDPALWVPLEQLPVLRVDWFAPLEAREHLASLVDPKQIPSREYAIRPYRPAADEILPFAWVPAVGVSGGEVESVGLSLLSGNDLQDRFATLTGDWDIARGGPEAALSLELGRWFPQVLIGAAYEQRDYPGTDDKAQAVSGSLGVRIPLTLDGVGARQGLTLEGRYGAGPVWAEGHDTVGGPGPERERLLVRREPDRAARSGAALGPRVERHGPGGASPRGRRAARARVEGRRGCLLSRPLPSPQHQALTVDRLRPDRGAPSGAARLRLQPFRREHAGGGLGELPYAARLPGRRASARRSTSLA